MSVQAVICEEIFDESSHPSVEEINEYATKIGIDPSAEPHLLHLAKEGLMQALPPDWRPCYDETSKSYYYYNSQSGRTQWEHPLDDIYRTLVVKVRSGSQASYEEDSKGHEDHTYTKEDLQSYEESLPKPLSFAKPPLSPVKLAPLRKKHLSPVKLKSKSMQDFAQKGGEFIFERTGSGFGRRSKDPDEKSLELKNFLLKDKHPNVIDKGELTLSGGGSMFLKSNTKKLVSQTSDSQLLDSASSSDLARPQDLPKSILRDRSLPETHTFSRDSSEEKRKPDPEDDRKSVRFNLDTTPGAERELEFPFTESTSSSDEEIEIFAETNLVEVAAKPSRFTVSPVVFDEYGLAKKQESLFAKIENAEKLEELATTRNSNLKLIKPNPTDFITPKLIGKPLEVVKTIADVDEDKFRAGIPKEDLLESEVIQEDKNMELTLADEPQIEAKTVEAAEESMDVAEEDSKRAELKAQMAEKLAQYKRQLQEENDKELEEFKQMLMAKKQQDIQKLVEEVAETQRTETEKVVAAEREKQESSMSLEIAKLEEQMDHRYTQALAEEELKFQAKLAQKRSEMERRYNETLDDIEHGFKEKEKEIENNFQTSLKQTENDFLLKLEERIKEISTAHKAVLDRMKDDHELTLEELLRDFKSEEEIIRKEQHQHLADLKDKVGVELELERQRMRDLGEDRLYEKVRCEKRLLEDKYRCLKEKYLRLKTDVKISLDRRNRRKEQSLTTTTTGSDTERSTSHKKGSTSERVNVNSADNKKTMADASGRHLPNTPRNLPKAQRTHDSNRSRGITAATTTVATQAENKNIQQIIIEDLDTSVSERSTRLSRNDNDDGQNGFDSSDGLATNPGRSRRKLFTRLKSNSTSRLNNNASAKAKELKRSCSPVENLRRQLQKLEDLEDQFPQTAPTDTYHLRYPFIDAGDIAGSSELEFFRHRIHLERDSVRRAKESLRSQRSSFQKRQRELKLRHGNAARSTLHQLYQEERELSDMEVSLHRTRSLLGEKVIRLRHLEQSLQRLSTTSSKHEDTTTLSDLSSHSASSGISSTEFATATEVAANGKSVQFREEHLQESSEIMQSLENLNSEIREIWDVLNKQQHASNVTTVIPPVPLVYSDHVWPVTAGNITLNAIPTLADRLHEYHQRAALAASHGVQSIVVTHPPRGQTAVTTTLVERTKNLRDWLRQAKAEQGECAGPGQATL
ncbi:uncharacterized protein CBL_01026 [Carabus blaptoides fortunei]